MKRTTWKVAGLLLIPGLILLSYSRQTTAASTPFGASSLKVVCDRWPDGSSMRQFSLDAIRLMDARTDEEKALAIWRFIRMWSAWTDGNVPREPALNDTYIDDPVKVLNVYGAHTCDGLARAMEVAWRSLGLPAEKLYRSGHTQANVYWQDTDGVSRWHLMDVSQGWYVYDRSAQHIATPDEIAVDYSLIFRPSKGPIPSIPHYWGMHDWVHTPHLPWPAHVTEIALRPNEKSIRTFGNLSLPYQDNYRDKGTKDFEHGPYPVAYGNGTLQYSPNLASESFADYLWTPPQNLASTARDGFRPNLHPAAAGLPAAAVWQIESPYIISDAWISGSYVRRTASDLVAFSISVDGGQTWRRVWQADQTGSLSLQELHFADRFDIYQTFPKGLISPFGRYRYLLKAELTAAAAVSDAGIDSLTITTVTQHNTFSLPQLWPGENRITVSGSVGPDTSLKVTYAWQDLLGADRRSVAVVESAPFTYVINTDGRKWDDVVTKSITVEAVPRIGSGNYIELREAQPATVVNVTQAQAFPTQQIVGRTYPPALKTAAQYILDLNDSTKQTQALSGLIVLKDRSALDAVKKVAYTSIAFPQKDLAVQALYQIGGRDSFPALLDILRKNPEVKWKYDAADKYVELEHWYQTSAMVGAMMAEAQERSAAPLLALILDNIIANNDTWWEPHSGIIRSLGRLGVADVAPSIRPFLNHQEDVSSTAIWALGELRDYASSDSIKDIFLRTSYVVRRMRAAEALGKLGRQDAYANFIAMLGSSDEDLRAAGAEALGRLGNVAAAPSLQDLINRETFPWVRAVAQASLAGLGKRPAAPTGLSVIKK